MHCWQTRSTTWACCLVLLAWCSQAQGQSQGAGPTSGTLAATPEDPVTFQEQLEKGLRARLPSEFAFIRQVVELVDEGTLSRDLVNISFDWARKKRRYQVQYFKRALTVLAAKRGISL